MERSKGKAIYKKIAIGKIYFYEKKEVCVKRERVADPAQEKERFETARAQAKEQLERLFEKAKKEIGESEAAIFEIHQMMLDDDDYLDSVHNIIEQQEMSAEYAVAVTGENFSEMFAEMDDEYMKARAADIKDISERVLSVLAGNSGDISLFDEPVILMAEDLAPSETVQIDKSKLLGFVTRKGSSNSHTAILARTMNIPAMIDVDIRPEWHGKLAILDGDAEELIVLPTEEELLEAHKRLEIQSQREELLKTMKGKETITSSGQKINLYANIGGISDTGAAMLNDAEGIGLFRSEFLYLKADDFPSETEQYQAYKAVAENMAGRKVVIRTLDIGADKKVDYFGLDEEENPALGYRAIRICLTRPDIFKTQLRAILRASVHGNISVMFPMIISKDEILRAKSIMEEAKAELSAEGFDYRDVETGIMIETPAAAVISDVLAEEVDFFSIGTNDLTQYTLAIDRQNPKLESFCDTHHDAVLKLIEMTVRNGHRSGIWVGICGELAADLELTETFLKMGVDELSVSPAFVLPLREKIRSL